MNRAFSKIWIIIALVIFIAGGIFAWQYFGMQILDENTDKPFNIKTYPPKKGDYKLANDIKEYYSLTYARSRYIIEEEIMRRRVDI